MHKERSGGLADAWRRRGKDSGGDGWEKGQIKKRSEKQQTEIKHQDLLLLGKEKKTNAIKLRPNVVWFVLHIHTDAEDGFPSNIHAIC